MFLRHMTRVALLAALPVHAWAADNLPKPMPPSPFADRDGVYDDRLSKCWVWDYQSGGALSGVEYQFTTSAKCDGKPLEGKAVVQWPSARRQGETWQGEFHEGRFTGKATALFSDAEFEGSYVDGMRSGPAVLKFKDGGKSEYTFAHDRLDGRSANIYAEGSREDLLFERGEATGIWTLTYADGSRVEVTPQPGRTLATLSGSYTAPDGKRLSGLYTPPRVDRANSPPLEYPQLALRLDEQGSVTMRVMVSPEGRILDIKLARSSGSANLDKSALEQTAKWRFIPAAIEGKSMAAMVIFAQRFEIR